MFNDTDNGQTQYCPMCEEWAEKYEQLKAELQKYKDMEAKGLEEFKEIGGCWGCGIQLNLNQAWEDIKRLKAENHALRQSIKDINIIRLSEKYTQYKQTLEEVREITDKFCSDCICLNKNCEGCITDDVKRKINEVLKDE